MESEVLHNSLKRHRFRCPIQPRQSAELRLKEG
jgi:hypothetical protein